MDGRGRAKYETLAAAVGRAIDDADPIGLLGMGCPGDEYSPEIGTIVPRVSKASTAGEVRRILHEEFVRWFGGSEEVLEFDDGTLQRIDFRPVPEGEVFGPPKDLRVFNAVDWT